MIEWLTDIRSRIVDGNLLPAMYYSCLDCDTALNLRDCKKFDAEWVQQYEEIERHWREAQVPAEVRRLIEDIRRESFLAVSRATRQHEIASYVSDDMELIVRSRLLGHPSEFLRQLWDAYLHGTFPMTFLHESSSESEFAPDQGD